MGKKAGEDVTAARRKAAPRRFESSSKPPSRSTESSEKMTNPTGYKFGGPAPSGVSDEAWKDAYSLANSQNMIE